MTFREKALLVAIGELGVKEHPPNTNTGPRVNQYLASAGLGPGFPWCMAFVNWCYRQAGLDIKHPNEASVGFFEDWARQKGYLVSAPKRGDIACYRFDSDNWPDHVGIVEEVGPGRITAVEGNTALDNDANGGMVMRRSRSILICKFARIPGVVPEEEDEVTKERVLELEKAAIAFDAGGRVLGTGPGDLPAAENAIFYSILRGIDRGNSVEVAALKGRLAQIHTLSA